ncbi:MAG: hypothetical protein ABIH70_02725 [Chloroflexota bacterium]
MIKTIIRFRNNMVMVFDEEGEQLRQYQGRYEEVKEHILQDATDEAVFAHGFTETGDLLTVSREQW